MLKRIRHNYSILNTCVNISSLGCRRLWMRDELLESIFKRFRKTLINKSLVLSIHSLPLSPYCICLIINSKYEITIRCLRADVKRQYKMSTWKYLNTKALRNDISSRQNVIKGGFLVAWSGKQFIDKIHQINREIFFCIMIKVPR